MYTDKWNEIPVTKVFGLLQKHNEKLATGSDAPLPKDYPTNILAQRLHPKKQYMLIKSVKELQPGVKEYTLVPDEAKGTTECAYFAAGQYVSVFLDINGHPVSRAYSLSSSPKDALKGFYTLTVKETPGGLVSNWILDHWKEGDSVVLSGPEGHFDYNPLRDAPTVIGIAGGSGITPFLSFAKAIDEGDEDFNLILLYGSRSKDQILYKDELDKLAENDKIEVVHVLSDEEADGYEHGFVTKKIIEKYAPDGDYSVFLCGPQAMYTFADTQLDEIGLPRRRVRHELFGEIHDPRGLKDYPGTDKDTVKITVTVCDDTKTIDASVHETILSSLEKGGIAVPNRCRSGECGWCHSKLVSGDIYIPEQLDYRRLADEKFGYFHPCAAFPLSDLELIVNPSK